MKRSPRHYDEYIDQEENVRSDSFRSYREEKRYYKNSQYTHAYGRNEPVYDKTPKRRKKKRGGTVFLCFLIILAIVIGVIWFTPSYKTAAIKAVLKSPVGPIIGQLVIGKNYETYVQDKNFDDSDLGIHEGITTPDGNLSVALFGVDARTQDLTAGTNADSMMIVNIDGEGKMKMASIYRDTYVVVQKPNGTDIVSKANSSYLLAGPEGAIRMMNENFDMALTDYIVVNFWGLSNIIDLMGGIRLKVTEEERASMEAYISEQSIYGDTEYTPLEESGENVLMNGSQATAFCRIRDVSFTSPEDGTVYWNDYARTARQRYTLTQLLKQMKQLGILKLLQVSNKLFEANSGEEKFIQTSLTLKEFMTFLALGSDMELAGNAAFPALDHQYNAVLDAGDCIVADTLEENAQLLHEYLYGTAEHVPTPQLTQNADQIRAEVKRQTGK